MLHIDAKLPSLAPTRAAPVIAPPLGVLMRLFLALFLICAAIAPLDAGTASAGETWCADDPIISVGGRLVDIQVQMPLANLLSMRSTELTVVIPNNVPGFVVLDDISAFPMRTTISRAGPSWSGSGPVPITVKVEVAAASNYPTRVVATPLLILSTPLAGPTTAQGVANTPLLMPMTLGR